MKHRVLFGFICVIVLIFITGCGSVTSNDGNSSKNNVKTVISCHNESFLFHSKKYVEHKVSLDKNNKLVQYEYIEKYFSFDDNDDFNMICDGSYEEAENNNKIYPYLKEVADCNRDNKEVVISDVYDISKIESKNTFSSDLLKESLNDSYVLDIDLFKSSFNNRGYECNAS